MARQLKRALLTLLILVLAPAARAQSGTDGRVVIVANAIAALDTSFQIAGRDPAVPDSVRRKYQAQLRRLRGGTPSLLVVARGRGGRSLIGGDVKDPESPAAWMRDLMNWQSAWLLPVLDRADSAERRKLIEGPIDDYRETDLTAVQQKVLFRLEHFEIKYGPGSPKLNPIEALANFVAQRWWPLRPGKDGVTPFEIVAGYSTTYGTLVDSEASAMSAAEFGLRIYNWGFDPDPDGVRRALTPRYWTVALAAASDRDGALRMPWATGARYGPLVSWGDFKVVYLHGKDEKWRLMVSRQIQLLPHLF